MARYPKLEFDRLQMYFREPYVIDEEDTLGSITVYQPTIGDIVRTGETKFFMTLNVFISNTTSYRLMLWDAGIDWNIMSDFELFVTMYKTIDSDVAKLMFGELDFSQFKIKEKRISEDKSEIVLVNEIENVEINEAVYQRLHQYLQNVFGIIPEEKITKSETMKQMYLQNDRKIEKNKEYLAKQNKQQSASMQSTISACVNHPGFKYKLSELREVGVCEFYDSVKRLQIYENATAVLKGMYSGMVDAKGISAESYNFMREF